MAFRRTQPPAPRLRRRTVRVRGLDLAVFLSPERPGTDPLLCINGGLLYGHDILWPALAPLAIARQLILYDQRGRGDSSAPEHPDRARIEDDAGDVPALRQALGYSRWDILGHSWGGGIAMLGAERDLAGTRSLVLVDSVGATSSWMRDLHAAALARLPAAERSRLQRFDRWTVEDPRPEIQSAYSRALYPAWFANADFARMFAPPRSESVTGAAVSARLRKNGYDWRPVLRALDRPTVVFHGERDLLPPAVAQELVEVLPKARLELVSGAGHMPFWESPDEFFPRVTTFLDSPERFAPSASSTPPSPPSPSS